MPPPEIMAEIAALAPSYAGVTHEPPASRRDPAMAGAKTSTHPGTPILHVGKFARGMGKFTPIDHIPPAELPRDEYPMVMSTGRCCTTGTAER